MFKKQLGFSNRNKYDTIKYRYIIFRGNRMKKCALLLVVLGVQSVYGMGRSGVSSLWDSSEDSSRSLRAYYDLQNKRLEEAGSPAVTALQLLENDNRQRTESAISRTPSASPRESVSPSSSPESLSTSGCGVSGGVIAGLVPFDSGKSAVTATSLRAAPLRRSSPQSSPTAQGASSAESQDGTIPMRRASSVGYAEFGSGSEEKVGCCDCFGRKRK